jgi:hypothetical protein
LELLACTLLSDHQSIVPDLKLFRLFMLRVMPASGTKLLHFQTLGGLFLVFGCRIVSFFAVSALHGDDVAH